MSRVTNTSKLSFPVWRPISIVFLINYKRYTFR
uniref:Uncharacterized protein n=1 Tax=Rhizophora mucronata TaxID=61149 RepID=A0A2P2PZ61_RHIMU